MNSRLHNAWPALRIDMWMLGAEAASVVALRTARIAVGGPAGAAEVELIVTEKVRAAIELQTCLIAGGLGAMPLSATRASVKHYRRKVATNQRRLG